MKYDTDKLIPESTYKESYAFHFLPLKEKVKVFFEIGVYKGGSLEMWADMFPDAIIVGIDIRTDYNPTRKNIFIEIGDGTDAGFLKGVIAKYGNPDIVLDDASHLSSHMINTFLCLFNKTKLIYCVEDLGTQYKSFENGNYIDRKMTMMDLLFDYVDSMNTFAVDYSQICFTKYQCFIYKK